MASANQWGNERMGNRPILGCRGQAAAQAGMVLWWAVAWLGLLSGLLLAWLLDDWGRRVDLQWRWRQAAALEFHLDAMLDQCEDARLRSGRGTGWQETPMSWTEQGPLPGEESGLASWQCAWVPGSQGGWLRVMAEPLPREGERVPARDQALRHRDRWVSAAVGPVMDAVAGS